MREPVRIAVGMVALLALGLVPVATAARLSRMISDAHGDTIVFESLTLQPQSVAGLRNSSSDIVGGNDLRNWNSNHVTSATDTGTNHRADGTRLKVFSARSALRSYEHVAPRQPALFFHIGARRVVGLLSWRVPNRTTSLTARKAWIVDEFLRRRPVHGWGHPWLAEATPVAARFPFDWYRRGAVAMPEHSSPRARPTGRVAAAWIAYDPERATDADIGRDADVIGAVLIDLDRSSVVDVIDGSTVH